MILFVAFHLFILPNPSIYLLPPITSKSTFGSSIFIFYSILLSKVNPQVGTEADYFTNPKYLILSMKINLSVFIISIIIINKQKEDEMNLLNKNQMYISCCFFTPKI